jgi:hypothetical protein
VPRLPRQPRSPLPALESGDTEVLPAGTLLWRVYFAATSFHNTWREFRSFGPVAGGRFDHHRPDKRTRDREILYCGVRIPGCLAEVFAKTRFIDRRTDEPYIAAFRLVAPLVLLDLRGPWPTRAGASQEISSGPHASAQAWSRAIYDEYASVDGLLYTSCMAGVPDANIALYDRADRAMPIYPVINVPLSHRGLDGALNSAATRFGYDLR